jgi:hypothetical protein
VNRSYFCGAQRRGLFTAESRIGRFVLLVEQPHFNGNPCVSGFAVEAGERPIGRGMAFGGRSGSPRRKECESGAADELCCADSRIIGRWRGGKPGFSGPCGRERVGWISWPFAFCSLSFKSGQQGVRLVCLGGLFWAGAEK